MIAAEIHKACRDTAPRPIRPATLGACLLAAAGCAVGPDYQPPEDPRVAEFAAADSGLVDAAEVEVEWWRQLQDVTLDRLIEASVRHNHDLRIAQANVHAARALLSEGRLEKFPVVTSEGSVTRQRTPTSSGTTFENRSTLYDAGLDALWELDFFGRVRRANEALVAEYGALAAERRSVLVTVTAEVARSYAELRGAQHQLAVTRRNAENQQKSLDLTQELLKGGRGTRLDVAQARAQLQSTRADIPPLETEVSRAMHRLAVLMGETPASLRTTLAPPAQIPELPAMVHIGNPADLLRRRPDIKAAERRLAASTARIGVAVADLFPRVTLFGSAGFFSTNVDDFGDEVSRRWSVGPGISWAAFDLGRVRARIRASEAGAEADLAAYEQTVLSALEETENALVRYVQTRQRQQRLTQAAESGTEAAELARTRFSMGRGNFLNVLDAERRQLEAQDRLARGRTESVLALIAVYKALGGGWHNDPPQTEQG